jgi:hypothetical protein
MKAVRKRQLLERAVRQALGWAWIVAWGALLYAVVSPWRELGGLVSERLRWLEWIVLGWGGVIGWRVGSLGRSAAQKGCGRTHARLLRWILLPPAALVAGGMLALRLTAHDDAIGVLLTGLLSYWAGLDAAFAAYPLARGEHYSFTGPIRSTPGDRSAFDEKPDPPHWMGL